MKLWTIANVPYHLHVHKARARAVYPAGAWCEGDCDCRDCEVVRRWERMRKGPVS